MTTSTTVRIPAMSWSYRRSTHCRKALLQLNDSSPAEFLKLVESARGATSEKTESRPQSESDATTDTSSDIGSTVREVNCQLEEESTSESESEDGNSGRVI